MECPSESRHFPNHSIKRLLADAGGRGRSHIVAKPTSIVWYLAAHLIPDCSTSWFYNYAFMAFFSCIDSATMVYLEWNCPPNFSFLCSQFMEKMQLQVYFRFISSCTEEAGGSAGTQHSSLSASAPYSGALLCNRTARALLHPLLTEQWLLTERLPQTFSAVCAFTACQGYLITLARGVW